MFMCMHVFVFFVQVMQLSVVVLAQWLVCCVAADYLMLQKASVA